MTSEASNFGEWTTEEPVTEEVENMCIQVEKQAGVHFDVYIPKTYMSQLVAGTNYLVKVKIAEEDKYLHARIFRDLPCNGGKLTVTAVQFPKTNSDHLKPF